MEEQLLKEIRKNIIQTKSGPFLQAGQHQFQSFWTRDFCFASWGLSQVGEYDVVKNHLQFLMDHIRDDGLVARIIESQWSAITVLLNTVLRFLPQALRKNYHRRKLRAEYIGEHGTLSIDSNSLVIISCFHYVKHSGDAEFLNKNREKIIKIFSFYENLKHLDLVEQGNFEDWQDSAKRKGKTFYTNLLYWYAGKLIRENGLMEFNTNRVKERIMETFFKDHIFLSMEDSPVVSLGANYLAIIFGFYDHPHELYQACDKLNFQNFPLCSQPNYPPHQISWTTKFVGLSHYHDQMFWSWILGAKLKAEKTLFNEYRSLSVLEELFKRDQTIYEIYDEQFQPFITIGYKSEFPFSWGLGIILWALKE